MGWRDFLGAPGFEAPWFGLGIVRGTRVWRVRTPPGDHGWYHWEPQGRHATPGDPTGPSIEWLGQWPQTHGHLVGDRLFCAEGTDAPVYCAPPCDRFDLITVAQSPEGHVYAHHCFIPSAASEARRAFEDGAEALVVPGATPELHRAFTWATGARKRIREAAERRRLQRVRRDEEAARRRAFDEALAHDNAGARRALVPHDFEEAARRALRVTGADLLDTRGGPDDTHVVRYRFRGRRLECVVDDQLRVVDAGVCLTDESTGVKYDTLFTLESLPGVVGEAMDKNVLVVWRHG